MTNSRNGMILVVDDEEIMREILETLLKREGYDVRLAASGDEGLELARSTPFDAAIVDIMMPGLNGNGQRMRQVFDLIIQAAPSRSTILIHGESGTGKELVARAIHANSSRSDRSFVTVNSGSLPAEQLDSTLFGHVKDAFTGAISA